VDADAILSELAGVVPINLRHLELQQWSFNHKALRAFLDRFSGRLEHMSWHVKLHPPPGHKPFYAEETIDRYMLQCAPAVNKYIRRNNLVLKQFKFRHYFTEIPRTGNQMYHIIMENE
jgi:hypothetical protein